MANSPELPRHVAVIGAGWSGCAAAVTLAQAGVRVSLLEAARTLGGRARSVASAERTLDNGQHILLGAYRSTLKLMQTVGVDLDRALLRLPLQMRYPAGCDGMQFVAPRLPAPWHVALALLRAQGLSSQDKMALARFSSAARWMGWQLNVDCSVATLLERFDQTERLIQLMWAPLCIAALNTPPQRASAKVFLHVLRDSLGARRAASDMLLPRADLSHLFPAQAAAFIERRGGSVNLGQSAIALRAAAAPAASAAQWHIDFKQDAASLAADGVVIATGADSAATLLDRLSDTSRLRALEYEAISTCYLQYPPSLRLPHAFYALRDNPEQAAWGQFVFDRGQLSTQAEDAGLLAVVISAANQAVTRDQTRLAQEISAQLAQQLQNPALRQPLWRKVISEKRATFACTPGLERPDNQDLPAGLALAGDYVASAYPATLEAATQSGIAAAQRLLQNFD